MRIKIILFFLISNFTFGQEYLFVEVVYNKAYKNYKDFSADAPKLMKNQEYKLKCNSGEALFSYEENMLNDSQINERFISRGGGDGIYYCNLKEDREIKQVYRSDDTYLIESKISDRKWEFTKETKYIDKYLCYKATTINSYISLLTNKKINVVITAWYTPEIPLSFGPTGFNGLPGLILEKSSSSFYYIATKISISKKSGAEIKRPTNGITISVDDYENLIRERFKEMQEN